jgi:hypothetical protein
MRVPSAHDTDDTGGTVTVTADTDSTSTTRPASLNPRVVDVV